MQNPKPSDEHSIHQPNWLAYKMLVHLLECKDPEIRGHSRRVEHYVSLLSQKLTKHQPEVWTPTLRSNAKTAAYLHDIGKIMVSKTTLENRGALNPEQLAELRTHPLEGERMLKDFYPLEVTLAIRQHHERWDGDTTTDYYPGYPDGLSRENISPIARAIKICDVYDAMTTNRSYSKSVPTIKAAFHITSQADIQFDPEYAWIFAEEVLFKRQSHHR